MLKKIAVGMASLMACIGLAASTPSATALSSPIPGLAACVQQSLVCGSGGQVLADDVATATSLGLPYLLSSLAPATSVLFLSGDSASTQTIVQGCAYKITQNSGYPIWHSTGLLYPDGLAGYQTNTDCAAWHLLAYGVYSSSTVANSMPWQRSFCRAIYADGVAFGGTTGATGTAWSEYGTSGGFPSGLQSEVNMACPVAWRPFFLGGAAPSANATYPAIINSYSNTACNVGITPASGAAPNGPYGTWAMPVNVSLTFVLRCYFPSGTFATAGEAPTAIYYRPSCYGALPSGDTVCPQVALGLHPGGTGPNETNVAAGGTFSATQVSPTSWQIVATVPSLWAQPDHARLGNSSAAVTVQLNNGNWEEVGTEDWQSYIHTHFAWAYNMVNLYVGTDGGIWSATPPWPSQAVGTNDSPMPNCNLTTVAGDPQASYWCLSQSMLDEWNADVSNPNNTWVSLCHGSLTNGTYIKQFGLRPYMADSDSSISATYVSIDYAACHDAAIDSYNRGTHLPSSRETVDQWIVGSRVPLAIYNKYFLPHQQPYTGWYPYTLQSTEILMGVASLPGQSPIVYDPFLGNTQIGFFNLGIYNWGASL